MSTNLKGMFFRPEGRVFVGHPEHYHGKHPHQTDYAIEVPLEHSVEWLLHVRKTRPGAYLTPVWSKNGTLMARYDGTPDNKVVLDHGDA